MDDIADSIDATMGQLNNLVKQKDTEIVFLEIKAKNQSIEAQQLKTKQIQLQNELDTVNQQISDGTSNDSKIDELTCENAKLREDTTKLLKRYNDKRVMKHELLNVIWDLHSKYQNCFDELEQKLQNEEPKIVQWLDKQNLRNVRNLRSMLSQKHRFYYYHDRLEEFIWNEIDRLKENKAVYKPYGGQRPF